MEGGVKRKEKMVEGGEEMVRASHLVLAVSKTGLDRREKVTQYGKGWEPRIIISIGSLKHEMEEGVREQGLEMASRKEGGGEEEPLRLRKYKRAAGSRERRNGNSLLAKFPSSCASFRVPD